MEVLGIILLLGMMGLAVESQSLSPQTRFDITGTGSPDMNCRPATHEELARAGAITYGKAAAFNLRGFYRCERNVFEYGERNSFINFVTKNCSSHADFIARRVKNTFSSDQIVVDIDTDRSLATLKPYLKTTYETALVQRLGPDFVLKQTLSSSESLTLRIHVRRVDDASTLFGAKVYRKLVGRAEGEWIDI